MNKSMPVGNFRRPELQAEHVVNQVCNSIPSKYRNRFPFQSNYEIYMAYCLATQPYRGCNPNSAQTILYKYPYEFRFFELDNATTKKWRRVTRKFNLTELKNFYSSPNYALGSTRGNSRFISGLELLIAVIDSVELIRQIMSELDQEIEQLTTKRKEEASNYIKNWKVNLEPEKAYYLFSSPSIYELADFFFVNPSYFVGEEPCLNCGHALTHWISVALGKGPKCGKHKYEIKLVGKNIAEISDYIIDLIERKFSIIKDVPLTPNSPLTRYRKSKMSILSGSFLTYLEDPFSKHSIMREIANEEVQVDWTYQVTNRVLNYLHD